MLGLPQLARVVVAVGAEEEPATPCSEGAPTGGAWPDAPRWLLFVSAVLQHKTCHRQQMRDVRHVGAFPLLICVDREGVSGGGR